MIEFDTAIFVKENGYSHSEIPIFLQNLRADLFQWYANSKRDLPWRSSGVSPWGILMSEIMLQQTTVTTVTPYWLRFMEKFPTPMAMAQTPLDDVLALWSGLGYYRRARNLYATAGLLATQYGNTVPPDFHTILKLPGIGRYTAGAVASFGFDISAPIVEANTARVLARLGAIEAPKNMEKHLWNLTEFLLPETDARTHNYALMELGSLLCKPTAPACDACPLSRACLAFKQGKTDTIPPPTVRVKKHELYFAAIVIEAQGHFLLRRIPQGEWHEGMMEFPKIKLDKSPCDNSVPQELNSILQEYLCISGELFHWKTVKYVVTNHKITLDVWRGRLSSLPNESPGQWVPRSLLGSLPFGTATRRLVKNIVHEEK